MSYQNELDDLNNDILAELYLRHLSNNGLSPRFTSPLELLLFLKNSPVRRDAENLTLSAYLRRLRTDAGIGLDDFASALNLPPEVLAQIESNDSVPWSLSPSLMAEVACLFRLHIQAIAALTENSYNIAYFSGRISDRDSATELMSTWLSEVRSDLQQRGANDLVA